MTNATTERVLNLLCDIGRPIILRYVSVDSCISSCRIGMQALRFLNIRSHPLPVKFAAFNEKAHEFMVAGHPEWAKEGKDGAYALGAGYGPGPKPSGWDGHLVLLVRGRYLLDLSADQASRPQHGIQLSPFYFTVPNGGGRIGKLVLKNPKGGTVCYESDPDNRAWKGTPDWKRSWDEPVRQVTNAVRLALKEEAK